MESIIIRTTYDAKCQYSPNVREESGAMARAAMATVSEAFPLHRTAGPEPKSLGKAGNIHRWRPLSLGHSDSIGPTRATEQKGREGRLESGRLVIGCM